MNLPALPSLNSMKNPDGGSSTKGSTEPGAEKIGEISAFSSLLAFLGAPAFAISTAEPAETGSPSDINGGKGGKELPGGLKELKLCLNGVTPTGGTLPPPTAAADKAGNILPGQTSSQPKMPMLLQGNSLRLPAQGEAGGTMMTSAAIAVSGRPLPQTVKPEREAMLGLAVAPAAEGQAPVVNQLTAQIARSEHAAHNADQSAAQAIPTMAPVSQPEESDGADRVSAAGDAPSSQSHFGERAGPAIMLPPMTEGQHRGLQASLNSALATHDSLNPVNRVEELVQAISNAREGEAGQTVRTTVSHAEFGVLRLRLSHGDEGLSAQIASNDAGFAPAAQNAVRTLSEAATNSRSDDQPRQQAGTSDHMRSQAETDAHPGFNHGHRQHETGANDRANRATPTAAPREDAEGTREKAPRRPGGGLFA